jgi:hypothetical protein
MDDEVGAAVGTSRSHMGRALWAVCTAGGATVALRIMLLPAWQTLLL